MSVDVLRFEGLLEGEELAYLGTEPERAAQFVALPDELDSRVAGALGVPALYAHQVETLGCSAPRRARDRHHRAPRPARPSPSTCRCSTRSRAIRHARALYLYPTKALAQDQFQTLSGYGLSGLKPAVYDGDTPIEHRRHIRGWANAILTNPDMIHIGVLPNHDRWGDVLANLRYVVVDEAHVYRGVFGSHVANVLRRLRRMARLYGAEPQFLLASATISNPGELGAALIGETVTVVGGDAAPRSERTIVLWNPQLLDPELGLRSLGAGRGRPAAGAVRRARAADADLREEPEGGRARASLHRGAPRRRHAPLAVPRRLHGGPAARDRTAAEGRRIARRLGDERARARDRHRPARLRDLDRLSRAPSRRCGSSGDAPDGAAAASRCSSRPRTVSTSSSCGSRTSCSVAGSRRRSSITPTRACCAVTCAAQRTKRH